MIAFADASAVVKLYADEAHADEVHAIADLVVSALSRVEVPSALWRKHRLGELDNEHARLLVQDFEADWYGTDAEPRRFLVVAMTPAVLEAAARAVAIHGLRSGDAVQLATATAARSADPACATMLAYDAALRRAAAVEGFSVLGT